MRINGIGVDLVNIPRMRDVIDRWRDRFLQRVFTEAEIAYCRARRDPVPHFAARFAAKEAGLKALGTGLRLGVSWRELEVRRERGQAPILVLSGRSRELGLARGGSRMLLALSHEGEDALAQAMLVGDESTNDVARATSLRGDGTAHPPGAGPSERRLPPRGPAGRGQRPTRAKPGRYRGGAPRGGSRSRPSASTASWPSGCGRCSS